MIELVISLCQLLFGLLVILLIPISLILATPFVLLLPRKRTDESYIRMVLRRYLMIAEILGNIGLSPY